MSDLDTVLLLLTHERFDVRKRAVDILALLTAKDEDVVAGVGTKDHIPRLIALLTSDNHLLHGSLLTALINMCASKQHGTEVARVLCECHCVARVMRILTAADEPQAALMDLMLILMTNVTSLGGSIASRAMLQISDNDSADTRGYFFEALLNKMVQRTCSASTGKWILNIATNVTSEQAAQHAVVEHSETMVLLTKCLVMCDPLANTFYALSILRNLCLAADGKYHKNLIDVGAVNVVLGNMNEDRPKGNTDIHIAYVEFIFILCTSKTGVEFMESINGKKTLVAVAGNVEHTLRTSVCADTLKLLEERLLTILDDIQDVHTIEEVDN